MAFTPLNIQSGGKPTPSFTPLSELQNPSQNQPTVGSAGQTLVPGSTLKSNLAALPGALNAASNQYKILPTVGAIGGGILGGLAGAGTGFLAGGVGAIPGGIAGAVGGATAGGAGGEALQEGINSLADRQNELNPGKIATTGAISGALEATTAGLGQGLKYVATAPQVAKFLSTFTGFGKDVVDVGIARAPATVDAVKSGESSLSQTVKDTSSKLSEYAQNLVDESKKTVDELSSLSGGGKGFPGTRQAILDTGTKFLANITDSLRSAYNIGVDKLGNLDFARSYSPSNIVSGGDTKAIQDAFDTVKNITKDTSIDNIDAAINRLMTLRAKTPVGAPTGAETKKIIGNMMSQVVGFTKSLGSVSPAYQKYADFLEQNLPKRVFVNDAQKFFVGTKNLSAAQVEKVSSKLLGLFKTGKLELRNFADQVGKTVGTNPVGSSAGTIINSGEKVSPNQIGNFTPRGIIERALESVPRALFKNYVKTGDMLSLENHPFIQGLVQKTGLPIKTIVQEVLNQLQQ